MRGSSARCRSREASTRQAAAPLPSLTVVKFGDPPTSPDAFTPAVDSDPGIDRADPFHGPSRSAHLQELLGLEHKALASAETGYQTTVR